jgi:hypothetical protein
MIKGLQSFLGFLGLLLIGALLPYLVSLGLEELLGRHLHRLEWIILMAIWWGGIYICIAFYFVRKEKRSKE